MTKITRRGSQGSLERGRTRNSSETGTGRLNSSRAACDVQKTKKERYTKSGTNKKNRWRGDGGGNVARKRGGVNEGQRT